MEKPSSPAVFTGALPHPRPPPHSSAEPAFSLGRDGSSRQKQLSKASKEAGTAVLASGERDSNHWWISATGQTELRTQEPCPCGPLRPVLQALRIRSQAPALGKVELVERMQSPKDWTSPAVWTEALCVPAQSLHLGAAPSWGIFARHCVGGCFAAACLASTLYGSSNAPPV